MVVALALSVRTLRPRHRGLVALVSLRLLPVRPLLMAVAVVVVPLVVFLVRVALVVVALVVLLLRRGQRILVGALEGLLLLALTVVAAL